MALIGLGVPAGAAEAHQNQRFVIAGTVESPTALVVAEGLVHGLGTLTAESAARSRSLQVARGTPPAHHLRKAHKLRLQSGRSKQGT